MLLKSKTGKIEVGGIIGLVALVIVIAIVALILGKGTSSANLFNLPCLIGGGNECEVQEEIRREAAKDIALKLGLSIECAYYRCVGNEKTKTPGCQFVKEFGLENICPCDKIDINKDGKVCGEESEKNPVEFKASRVTLEKVDVINVKPIGEPLHRMFVNEKCDTEGSFVNLMIDERLLVNKNQKKDCDGKTEYGEQDVCRVNSNADIFIYHKRGGEAKAVDHVVLCSQKSVFATKPGEGTPQGPVTLFEHEKSKRATSMFLNISNNIPDIGNLKNEVTSVELADNYGVTLYEKYYPLPYTGNCRTFFSSVDDLREYDFNDEADSVKVWKNGFEGAILHDWDLQSNRIPHKDKRNEFYPNDGKTYRLKDTDCVHEKVSSVEVSQGSVVVLYEGDNGSKISYVTRNTETLPPSFKDKATHVKVCPNESCLTAEEAGWSA